MSHPCYGNITYAWFFTSAVARRDLSKLNIACARAAVCSRPITFYTYSTIGLTLSGLRISIWDRVLLILYYLSSFWILSREKEIHFLFHIELAKTNEQVFRTCNKCVFGIIFFFYVYIFYNYNNIKKAY